MWLSPTQALIIPIKDTLREYAIKVKRALEDNYIRADVDERNETLDKRIRQAELNKIPYILIAGEREEKKSAIAIRKRGAGDIGAMPIEEFVRQIKKETDEKVT